MRVIGIGAAGLRGQQFALETIGNNVANVNTPGFKASNVDFAEAFQARLGNTSATNGVPAGGEIGSGAGILVTGVGSNFRQGILTPSDNPWDLAIDGDGFFQMQTPGGQTAYTRAGSFQLDGEGNLVDTQGNFLLDAQSQKVTIPAETKEVIVRPDGMIVLDGQNGQQLQLAKFRQPEGLKKIGGSLFVPTVNSGVPEVGNPGDGTLNLGQLRSQMLEQSNVDIATTMTNLIEAQRAYEMNSKMVQAGDEMWSIANSLRR